LSETKTFKWTARCQSKDCRGELAKVYFSGMGNVVEVECSSCHTKHEVSAGIDGYKVRVMSSKDDKTAGAAAT